MENVSKTIKIRETVQCLMKNILSTNAENLCTSKSLKHVDTCVFDTHFLPSRVFNAKTRIKTNIDRPHDYISPTHSLEATGLRVIDIISP